MIKSQVNVYTIVTLNGYLVLDLMLYVVTRDTFKEG